MGCSPKVLFFIVMLLLLAGVAMLPEERDPLIPEPVEVPEPERGPFPAWPWLVPLVPLGVPVMRLWYRRRRLAGPVSFRYALPVAYYTVKIRGGSARRRLGPSLRKALLLCEGLVIWYTNRCYQREVWEMLGKLERRLAAIGRWVIALTFMGLGCVLGTLALQAGDVFCIVVGIAGFVCCNLVGIVWLGLTA